MKSVGSCFPNCQISYEDFLIFLNMMFCSSSSLLKGHNILIHFYNILHFIFLFSIFLSSLITIQIIIMGMTADSQFHVLAVDDSVIDRMLIEKLLKTSSFHGTFFYLFFYFLVFFKVSILQYDHINQLILFFLSVDEEACCLFLCVLCNNFD